jgi:hypothetical protein
VHDVAITNLIVQGYQLDGINVFDDVYQCRLIQLTCRGNGRAGITVANAARAIVDRCLIGDNGAVQLLTEGWSRTRLEETTLVANTAPAYHNGGASLFIDGEPVTPGAKP